MNLRQLNGLIAVAEELHFGRAAEKCHIAPPVLSRHIKTLEQELGVTLLKRTTRAVALTRAGLRMVEEAKRILANVDSAVTAVRNAHAGSGQVLRVGAIDSASAGFLTSIVADFRKNHPAIDIQFIEAMTGPLLQMLEAGRLDLCLIRPPRRTTDCKFEVLRAELPIVILPARHRLLAKSSITIEDLLEEQIIIPARRSRPYAYDLVMAHFESAGAMPKISIEATEKLAMMAAVQSGLGVAIAPDWVSRLSFPGVAMRRLDGQNFDPPHDGSLVGMAWRPQQRFQPRDDFIELLREKITYVDDALQIPQASSPIRLVRGGKRQGVFAN
jgi:DNA-binding transcriptional LysR family regulator